MLSAPEMWSTVPRINTRWTKLCLERSRDVLLDISVDSKEWIRCIPAIHSVLLHMERARSLYLWFEDLCRGVMRPKDLLWNDDIRVARKKILNELVVREAPNLEKVHLGFDGRFDIGDSFIAPILPDGLFDGKPTPQLKDMSLEYCIIITPIFIRLLSAAAALTHLYLRDVRAWDSVDDMVQCLDAAPRLRSLHWVDKLLEYNHFAARRSDIHASRCVHLDELMELQLGGSHTQNMVVFSYLSIPGTTRLTMNSSLNAWSHDRITHGEIEDLTALFAEALRDHFACASARGAYFDSVLMFGNGGVRVEPEDPANTVNDITPSSLSKLLPAKLALSCPQITYGHAWYIRHRRNFLDTLLSLPVFNRARSVNYSSLDVIHRFCEVHEIRIGNSSGLREFSAAFIESLPCPLPHLDRLHLEDIDFIAQAGIS
ncbi:hypothetical protein PENSPDRAFT_659465 [Peniophora sp. CONT]|nr:hypothetical protein PENSPDRAFT_659465 [Peniophora sp. CONT]